MEILVICPMEIEASNFKKALKSIPHNHNYKVVQSGIGKAAAAATAALEVSNKNFDLVAVVGYAAAHGYQLNELVIPMQAAYHDVDAPSDLCPEITKVYDLNGIDNAIILTGDSFITKDNYQSILAKFPGKKVLFDMEATAVCQIVDDYNPETNVAVLKLISDLPAEDTSFAEFVQTHTDFSQFVFYLETLE